MIPDSIKTPEFEAEWAEWLAYRRERKTKTTARTMVQQLAFLAQHTPAEAAEMLRTSIRNGWSGLFAPKATAGPQRRSQPDGLDRLIAMREREAREAC